MRFDILDIINKLQLKFYKLVLKLKASTPSHMVYCGTGRYPVAVSVKARMLCFWFKLVAQDNKEKLSSVVYRSLLSLYMSKTHQNAYLKKRTKNIK